MVHDAAIFLLFTSGRHFSYSAFIDDFLYKAVYKIRKSRPNVFEMNDLLWILGFCILEWQPILKHFISIVKCQNTAKTRLLCASNYSTHLEDDIWRLFILRTILYIKVLMYLFTLQWTSMTIQKYYLIFNRRKIFRFVHP